MRFWERSQIGDAGLARSTAEAERLMLSTEDDSDYIEIAEEVHFLSRILLPSFERALQLHFRTLAHRRMAAIVLAIRLCELDRGQVPGTRSKTSSRLIFNSDLLPRIAARGRSPRPASTPQIIGVYSHSTAGEDAPLRRTTFITGG